MGVTVWAMRTFLPVNRLITILEVIVGVAVFGAVALADHALTAEDLKVFTGRRGRGRRNVRK